MATYFIGTEFDALQPINFDIVQETGGGYVDWFARGSVECYRNGGFDIFPRDYTSTGQPIAVPKVWLHSRARIQTNPDSLTWIQFYGAAGTPVVRLECKYSDSTQQTTVRFSYNNAGTWTPIGDPAIWPQNQQPAIDVHVKVASAGRIELFMEGVLVTGGSLDTSAFGNITRVRLGPSRFEYGGTWFAEVILASYSTIGHRVRRKYPTTNGTYTDWTGDYQALDEFATGYNTDFDSISTDTVGSRESYTGLTFQDNGQPIKAVAVAQRFRVDDESQVRAVRSLLVMGGNDYVSPPIAGTASITASEWVFDKNPANNSDWTLSAVNSAEFGVKSSDGGSN